MIDRRALSRAFLYSWVAAGGLSIAAALSTAVAATSPAQSGNRYSSGHVGIAFDYPPGYSANLSHENDGTHQWHMVTVRKAPNPTGDSKVDGAPRITICVFENERKLPPPVWIESSQRAAPSASRLIEGSLGADPSASYDDPTGVHHLAVLHDGLIYYYSVYERGDPGLVEVFQQLIASVTYPPDAPP